MWRMRCETKKCNTAAAPAILPPPRLPFPAWNVIPSKPLIGPRVESATHIMTVGLGGSLEDALRTATASLGQWLEQDYSLNPSEIAQVLGTSVELVINEVADRNAGVAAKLRKSALANLPRAEPKK